MTWLQFNMSYDRLEAPVLHNSEQKGKDSSATITMVLIVWYSVSGKVSTPASLWQMQGSFQNECKCCSLDSSLPDDSQTKDFARWSEAK